MPYTPPSRRSPNTSSSNSPSLTRNHSYDKQLTASSTSRPEIPRSKSATYIHKHRRAPSLPENTSSNGSTVVSYTDGTTTVAQSKPHLAKLTAHQSSSFLGAERFMSSPTEVSPHSSEDDEERGRSRQIANLAETLRGSLIGKRRAQSPTGQEEGSVPTAPRPTPSARFLSASSPGLTPEARKIAHSRSSSDLLTVPCNVLGSFSDPSSPGDSDEDGLEMRRVPLVRKKSGELVKPALRASSKPRPVSAPGTPSYPKAVHFNEQIEQVRHFLQLDKPMAVSADSSPVELDVYESEMDYPFNAKASKRQNGPEWDIKLANFPGESHERKCMPVRVEQIHLSKDGKSLIGVVAVANIAFEKWVVARFTFDYWKTTSEVFAEYNNVPFKHINDGYDRFQFSIRLSDQANLQNKTMYLCARYNSGGQEHWDSNNGGNFQVDFVRNLPKQRVKPATQGGSPGLPRSRHTSNSPLPRPRSFPMGPSDDEFTTNFASPFRIQDKTSSDGDRLSLDAAKELAAKRLSNRYDFNSSLHAALATAQQALGDDSGLKLKQKPTASRKEQPATTPAAPVIAPLARPSIPTVTKASDESVPSLTEQAPPRPTLGSIEYQDLISKFCYFGSGGTNSALASPRPEEERVATLAPATKKEEIDDSSSASGNSSTNSSATNSPPSPKAQLHTPQVTSESKTSTRTNSPSLRAMSPHVLPYRSPSPALSAYQEFPHQGLSVQSAQC